MKANGNGADIVLVQTVVPDYRQPVIDALVAEWGDTFHVYCGEEYFQQDAKSAVKADGHVTFVNNLFLLNRRALFQIGPIFPAFRARCAIVEFNPRILNTWIVTAMRRMFGRKTVLWGHALGRGGDDKLVRRLLRKLAQVVLVYTEEERRILTTRKTRSQTILSAPNSLFRQADMIVRGDSHTRNSFIYVGRMIANKKPAVLLKAFAVALPDLPDDCRLYMIGKGPLLDELRALSTSLKIADRVDLPGYVSDEDCLAYYEKSIASVSPGYVGLSVTQSLGYGIPMIISRDEPHAPEIEAMREDWNSVFFATDDVNSLAAAMVNMCRDKASWIARSSEISNDCRSRYSIETMVQGFFRAADICLGSN
ncbi:MAG: hypothetical protein C0483_10090 [Pirellula sp.]|nr:hypothetical protein [Pirellula sp.]